MDKLNLIGPTYPSFGLATEAQATINLYPEFVDSGDKADAGRVVLTGTPGRVLVLANGGGNNCGGCIVPSNIPFIPNGATPVAIAYYMVADNSPDFSLYVLNAAISAGAITYTRTLIANNILASYLNAGANGVLPAQIIVLDQVGASGQNLLFVVASGKAYLYAFGKPISGTPGVVSGGTGYAVNDTGTILGWGGYAATYRVSSTTGSTVTGIAIVNAGNGYTTSSPVATATGGTQPGSGSGLTLNVTAASATWTGYQLAIPNTDVSFTNYIASATFMDGYVIVSLAQNTQGAGARQFYNSAVNDASTWDPRSVSTKEGNPDPIVAVYAFNELLGIFGTQTTEFWYDAGASASGSLLVPFQRLSSAGVITGGLGSTWAISKVNGTIAGLGLDQFGNTTAWILNGYQFQRLSTHAIENAWRNYNVTGASLYCYEENGHTFLIYNFPIAPNGPDGTLSATTVGATWAYDLTTQMWHQRGSFSGTTAPTASAAGFNNEFPRFLAFVQNVGHLVLDYFNGNIYTQAIDIFSDVSQNSAGSFVIARLRRTPHFRDGLRRIGYPHVRVLAQAGSGNMTLSISNDGAFTYVLISSQFMGFLPIQPLDWWCTGYARDRVFQLFSTDAIKQVWVEGYAEFNASLSQF